MLLKDFPFLPDRIDIRQALIDSYHEREVSRTLNYLNLVHSISSCLRAFNLLACIQLACVWSW